MMLTKKETQKSTATNKSSKAAEATSPLATKAAPVKVAKNLNEAKATVSSSSAEKKNQQKTKIIVKYDVGFKNHLSIRGNGANLCWNKGQPLKNTKVDEWVWETDANATEIEYKVLINDSHYELGENHSIRKGSSVIYTPRF